MSGKLLIARHGESEWNAKGDLWVGQTNDLAARLSVGMNGQILTADSGETLGVKWADPGAVTPTDTDFSGITGLIAHFKASEGVTQSGGRVSDWDGVASTETATQSDANYQPYYYPNGALGQPAIFFNNTFMDTDVVPPSTTDPRTIVAVFDQASYIDGDAWQLLCTYGNDAEDEAFGLAIRTASEQRYGFYTNNLTSVQPASVGAENGPGCVIITYDDAGPPTCNMYWNGILVSFGSLTVNTGTDFTLVIGGDMAGNDQYYCRLMLYELAVLDVALDATARTDIFNQVYAKYGGQVGTPP